MISNIWHDTRSNYIAMSFQTDNILLFSPRTAIFKKKKAKKALFEEKKTTFWRKKKHFFWAFYHIYSGLEWSLVSMNSLIMAKI